MIDPVYDANARRAAVTLLRSGQSQAGVSRSTGISRAALREWLAKGVEPRMRPHGCPRCVGTLPGQEPYVYLLGRYLGDGCISDHARTTALRIACCDDWPELIDRCAEAVEAVSGRSAFFVASQGCTHVTALWKHWPCLFPQHGPGRKHERRIVLERWQQELVEADPRPLVRGLIHSDGCRVTNWTERRVGGTVKRYTYPRYFFSNASADIRGILTDALDRLGIDWRQNAARSISVARREAVAALDAFVGPKS